MSSCYINKCKVPIWWSEKKKTYFANIYSSNLDAHTYKKRNACQKGTHGHSTGTPLKWQSMCRGHTLTHTHTHTHTYTQPNAPVHSFSCQMPKQSYSVPKSPSHMISELSGVCVCMCVHVCTHECVCARKEKGGRVSVLSHWIEFKHLVM